MCNLKYKILPELNEYKMPLYPGLLVSCRKNQESSASSEIYFTLVNELDIDSEKVHVANSGISGLVTVQLDEELDYDELVRKMMKLDNDDPYFMYCLKIKPIHHTMELDIDEAVKYIKGLEINRSGSYRITVSKRHTPISSMDLIEPVAILFLDYDVDLEDPKWEILLEVIADKLGISLIEPELIFSTQLAFEEFEDETENWFLS